MISPKSNKLSFYYRKRANRRLILFIGAALVLLATSGLGIHKARTAGSLLSPAAPSLMTPTRSASGPFAVSPNSRRIRTDRAVYREPRLPSLPRAGGKFNDPVFGTQIMRVTDASECPAPGCGTYYNQWPTFNSDNTRIIVRRGDSGDVIIKAFDPVNFTLGPTVRSTLKGDMKIGGTQIVDGQGATWSRTDPDLIYMNTSYYGAHEPALGMKLYAYRPSSNTFTLLKDFAPGLSPGNPDFLYEMHIDAHDNIFSFMQHRLGNSGNPLYYIIWKRSTDRVLLHIRNDTALDANAAIPDKSGRWIFFALNKVQPDKAAHKVYDLQTKTWQTIYWLGTDDSMSHGDVGTGTAIGHGNFSGAANLRSLGNVHKRTMLFDYKDANGVVDWSQDQHMTLYADDESWATMALWPAGGPNNTGTFASELMQFATDGSQRIRRLFHHRSVIDNHTPTSGYWAIPKPTISRDGRFIAFTSNWGKSGRYDLFIAKIVPAPRLSGAVPVRR